MSGITPAASSSGSSVSYPSISAANQFQGGDLPYFQYDAGNGTFTGDNTSLTFSESTNRATPANLSNQGGSSNTYISSELAGTYNFTVKGDSLLISKTLNGQNYCYKLRKQPAVPVTTSPVIPPPLTGTAAHLDGNYAGYCTGTVFALVNPMRLFTMT